MPKSIDAVNFVIVKELVMKYTVLREHWGDKQYNQGDVRTVTNEQDAKTLIAMGLIGEKSEPVPPKNKMAKDPVNKSE